MVDHFEKMPKNALLGPGDPRGWPLGPISDLQFLARYNGPPIIGPPGVWRGSGVPSRGGYDDERMPGRVRDCLCTT